MHVDIVSDTVCPWCYIGKRRFEAALAEHPDLDVTVRWRPFQLDPSIPEGGVDRAAYLSRKFGGDAQAEALYERVREAGKAAGIPFDFGAIVRSPNSIDSHRLIRWADDAGRQDQAVTALFRRYFEGGEDIGDHLVLQSVADEVGLDVDGVAARLADETDTDAIRREIVAVQRMGVGGVPFYLFDKRFAVTGAQEPATWSAVFAHAAKPEVRDAPKVDPWSA